MKIYEYVKSRSADLDAVQRILKDIRETPAEPHANAGITEAEVATLDSLLQVQPQSDAEVPVEVSIAQRETAVKEAEARIEQQADSIQKAGASMDVAADVREKEQELMQKERELADREQALIEATLRSSQAPVEGEVFTHDDLARHVESKGEDPKKVDLAKWLKDHGLPSPQRKFLVSGVGEAKGKVVAPEEVFAVDETAAINVVVRRQKLESYRYKFSAVPVLA